MGKEEPLTIDLLHRAVPVKHTGDRLRSLSGESSIHPERVQKYLESKFGDASKIFLMPFWIVHSLGRPLIWREKLTPCTKNSGRRSPGQKGGGCLRQARPG